MAANLVFVYHYLIYVQAILYKHKQLIYREISNFKSYTNLFIMSLLR